jgi:hypothetical protein
LEKIACGDFFEPYTVSGGKKRGFCRLTRRRRDFRLSYLLP